MSAFATSVRTKRVHACLAISLAFATSVKMYSFMLWGGAAVSGHVGACLDVFGTGIAAAPFLNTVPLVAALTLIPQFAVIQSEA